MVRNFSSYSIINDFNTIKETQDGTLLSQKVN